MLGYGEDATAAPDRRDSRAPVARLASLAACYDAANDTTYDNDRQVRIANLGLEVGVLKRFSIGANVPWVVTKTLTFVSSPHNVTVTRHDSSS